MTKGEPVLETVEEGRPDSEKSPQPIFLGAFESLDLKLISKEYVQ
jgi:hypothetical protein